MGWLAFVVLVGPVACKSEQRRQHERLAQTLDAPMQQLCRIPSREAGGCMGDCPIWVSAKTGRAATVASEALLKIGPFEDAETEALLGAVRKVAEGVRRDVGAACAERIDQHAPVSPRVRACADAANANSKGVHGLIAAATALAARVSAHASVELPRPYGCPD